MSSGDVGEDGRTLDALIGGNLRKFEKFEVRLDFIWKYYTLEIQ